MEAVVGVALIIGTVWVAQIAITMGYERINRRRDDVMIGIINGTKITADHRRIILTNDYKPLSFGLVTSMATSGMIIAISPALINYSSVALSVLSVIIGTIQIIRALLTARFVAEEVRVMALMIGSIGDRHLE